MDKKTLEYMGTRVDMARALTQQIDTLSDRLARVVAGVSISAGVMCKHDTRWLNIPDAILRPAFVKAAEEALAKLQEELDAL